MRGVGNGKDPRDVRSRASELLRLRNRLLYSPREVLGILRDAPSGGTSCHNEQQQETENGDRLFSHGVSPRRRADSCEALSSGAYAITDSTRPVNGDFSLRRDDSFFLDLELSPSSPFLIM